MKGNEIKFIERCKLTLSKYAINELIKNPKCSIIAFGENEKGEYIKIEISIENRESE